MACCKLIGRFSIPMFMTDLYAIWLLKGAISALESPFGKCRGRNVSTKLEQFSLPLVVSVVNAQEFFILTDIAQ